MELTKVPGHESVFPLDLATRLLKLSPYEMKNRMKACGVTLHGVEGERKGFILAADLHKMVDYTREKQFWHAMAKSGHLVKNPRWDTPGSTSIFLDRRVRIRFMKLWKTVRFAQRRRGKNMIQWNQFLSICLKRSITYLWGITMMGEEYWDNIPWQADSRMKYNSRGQPKPVARAKWPQPISVPEWMLAETWKPGRGSRGVRRKPKADSVLRSGGGVSESHGLDQNRLDGEEED